MQDKQTYDLFEFRWDSNRKVFLKWQKHMVNQSKALCYAKKKALLPIGKVRTGVLFVVVVNGSLEHTNQYKPRQQELSFQEPFTLK